MARSDRVEIAVPQGGLATAEWKVPVDVADVIVNAWLKIMLHMVYHHRR